MLRSEGEDDIVKSVRAVGAFSCLTGIEFDMWDLLRMWYHVSHNSILKNNQ